MTSRKWFTSNWEHYVFTFRCELDYILDLFLLELLELKCPVTAFLETMSLWLTNLSPAVCHEKSMSVQQLTGTNVIKYLKYIVFTYIKLSFLY